ncbi:hypothetical protein RB195_008474 [Necator americanus]|uniref:Uncharacterized protein n=1 Tax=Necator americanus TaxID=51031 RepID=A0ABR1CQ34_NECAM
MNSELKTSFPIPTTQDRSTQYVQIRLTNGQVHKFFFQDTRLGLGQGRKKMEQVLGEANSNQFKAAMVKERSGTCCPIDCHDVGWHDDHVREAALYVFHKKLMQEFEIVGADA